MAGPFITVPHPLKRDIHKQFLNLFVYISPLVTKATGWEDCGIVEFCPSFFAKETYQEALEATCKASPRLK